jgi:hypothetical protein
MRDADSIQFSIPYLYSVLDCLEKEKGDRDPSQMKMRMAMGPTCGYALVYYHR